MQQQRDRCNENIVRKQVIGGDAIDTKCSQVHVALLCSTLHMRLFVALDLDESIRQQIAGFIEQMRSLAPNARWMNPDSLHITLKFIGEQPDTKVKDVETALEQVSGAGFPLSFRGCGFFPTAKSARVFWAGIEADPELGRLAADIETALEPLGIEREKRAYSPHLTLARAGGGSGAPSRQRGDRPNCAFSRVQERPGHAAAPEFGTMTACEFFLYRSQLSSQGAKYSKLARFPLEKA